MEILKKIQINWSKFQVKVLKTMYELYGDFQKSQEEILQVNKNQQLPHLTNLHSKSQLIQLRFDFDQWMNFGKSYNAFK